MWVQQQHRVHSIWNQTNIFCLSFYALHKSQVCYKHIDNERLIINIDYWILPSHLFWHDCDLDWGEIIAFIYLCSSQDQKCKTILSPKHFHVVLKKSFFIFLDINPPQVSTWPPQHKHNKYFSFIFKITLVRSLLWVDFSSLLLN